MWVYYMFRDVLQLTVALALLYGWIAGVVIAKGFWSTTFTIFVFPYAWYLVVEKYLMF